MSYRAEAGRPSAKKSCTWTSSGPRPGGVRDREHPLRADPWGQMNPHGAPARSAPRARPRILARTRARARARARRPQETENAVQIARSFHRSAVVFHLGVMVRAQLRDEQWEKVKAVLEWQQGAGRRGSNDRNFIEAVLWWRRTGVPWRDLPSEFGPWKTVFNRFDRWSKRGKWMRLFEALRTDPDDEWHSRGSTINRAHQHAAGGKRGLRPKASADRVAA